MRKIVLTLVVALMATTMIFAQAKREREVKNLFAQIEKTNDDFKKTALANRIQNEMIEILIEADDFYYDFPSLKNVGKILSSDEQIHMYTWNVVLSDGSSQYYALFQHNEFNSIYIMSQGDPIVPATTGYVSEKDWYGALYYEIHPIKFKDKEAYVVFGLMTSTDDETQHKVIDVMTFTKKAIKFGAPSFLTPWTGKKKQHRVVFAYDKNAQMTLDYNHKKKTITFDHLAPIRKTSKGKDVFGPDMSHDALIYKKDIWEYKADVKVKNKKEKKGKK
jgi:hypothetical protein